jgi:hypothetical protein
MDKDSTTKEIKIPENIDLNTFDPEINNSFNVPECLKGILETQKIIRQAKEKKITFSDPIIYHLDRPIIFPNTINAIQGQNGSHKSRLAETICSSLLRTSYCKNNLLGFKANLFKSYSVIYIDTERNIKEQLPHALQSIQVKAGYDIEDHPRNFDFISLQEIERKNRFAILKEYLKYVRQIYSNHIFIILDVITDCLRDFNKTEDSLELIDEINSCINAYDVTFLCLIHENPGTGEKARGHLGTEIWNKSSTALQVSFEKSPNGENTDLIRVKFIKCRSTKKYDPFYVKYSEEEKGLILANENEIRNATTNRQVKANENEILEYLEQSFSEATEINKSELETLLVNELSSSIKTIGSRLKDIMNNNVTICHKDNIPHVLRDKFIDRKKFLYLYPFRS